MELQTHELPASIRKYGEETDIVVAAGRRLVIETSPSGGEILDAEVPTGKQWTVTVSVSIDETDA